jgi:hypothetical protein
MKRIQLITMFLAGLGAVAAAALALPTASASAGLTAGPLEYEVVDQPVGPGSSSALATSCSAPQRVTGGGASIKAVGTTDGEQDSAILSAAPYDGPDFDLYADNGFRMVALNEGVASRMVTATAICLADGASLTYEKNQMDTTSTAFSQSAPCEAGRLLGGGAYVGSPHAHGAAIATTVPYDDNADPKRLADDGWLYRAVRADSTSIAVAAHAICMPKGERAVRYRSKTTTAGPLAKAGGGVVGGVKVECPKRFHASGGGVAGDLRLRTSEPYDGTDKGLAPDDGWKARFYAPGGAEEVVDVRVVCLR